MSRRTLFAVGLVSTLFLLVCLSQSAKRGDAQAADEDKVANFMQSKLEHAQDALEGLVIEDFGMIKKGAEEMITMSKATEWVVIKGPVYEQYSSEFQRACEQLIKTADDENVDGASLAYLRVTMSCVSCHKFVRGVKVAAGETPSPALIAENGLD